MNQDRRQYERQTHDPVTIPAWQCLQPESSYGTIFDVSYCTRVTGGGVQVPSRIEGGVSLGE